MLEGTLEMVIDEFGEGVEVGVGDGVGKTVGLGVGVGVGVATDEAELLEVSLVGERVVKLPPSGERPKETSAPGSVV